MTVKEAFNVAGLPTTWGFDVVSRTSSRRRLGRGGAAEGGRRDHPRQDQCAAGLGRSASVNPVYGRTLIRSIPAARRRLSGGAARRWRRDGAADFGSDIGGSIRVPVAL